MAVTVCGTNDPLVVPHNIPPPRRALRARTQLSHQSLPDCLPENDRIALDKTGTRRRQGGVHQTIWPISR
jgi:hypothetical protein